MNPQKPSIGRVVHYYYLNPEECEPNPAVVTRVYSDGSVDLHVLGDIPDALAHNIGPIVRCKHYSDSPAAGEWTWPPRT